MVQPSGVAAANTRSTNGRGVSWPSLPHRRGRQPHQLLADKVDAAVGDRLAQPLALGRRQIAGEHRPLGWKARERRGRRRPRSRNRRAATALRSRADFWPHHQVAMCGIFRSSPSRRRHRLGRKPSSARASSTPEPGMLATTTPSLRSTSIRPGTPSCEDASSSSGSSEIGIDPAQQHVEPLQPGDGADMDAVAADGEIVALDQQEAEIARQRGVLEIGLAEGARRQQADARLVAVGAGAQRRRGTPRRTAPRARHSSTCRARKRRATAPGGFPARSPRPTAPACGRSAPTSGHRGRGRHRRHRGADSGRPAA